VIRAIVTDIEGTTSSLSAVKDVLFPYARRHLREFVARRREDPEVRSALAEARTLANTPGADEDATLSVLERWMDEDRKATPLKALQGILWEEGYRKGALRSEVYPDVVPAFRALKARGLPIHVYSSGSIRAQKVFFEHTNEGDLRSLFDGYFDTTTGPKTEPGSYRSIAEAVGVEPREALFLTDARGELQAASAAGLQVLGVIRPPAPPASLSPFPAVTTFADIAVDTAGELSLVNGAELDALLDVVKRCHARGWVLATSGNFSVRAAGERLAITASGRDKRTVTRADVVLAVEGSVPLTGPTPSAETPLHRAIYRRFPRAAAVAHTHSVAATVLSQRHASRGILEFKDYEMQKALTGEGSHQGVVPLPVVANSQDIAALVHAVDAALDRFPGAPGYLVAGHGLTTWSADVPTLERHVEALEFLLACELASSHA